jgi:hypothetical protein
MLLFRTKSLQQGRTTLLFELDLELHQELPTIVTRSKEDLPAMEELVSGEINPEIIEKVSKIMTVLKHGHKRVKKIGTFNDRSNQLPYLVIT